jgi:hypothetical protein
MIRRLDISAIMGMALGIAMILQPWWGDGLRYGFFVTLFFAVLHTLTSHLSQPPTP